MQHARDRIRDLTGRRRLGLWPELIAEDINMFLRGWAAYFKYGHSARRLSTIKQYARMRLALFVSKKHRRSRSFGWRALVALSPDEFGLISLYGITVAPRAGKPWRDKPNAGVNSVGEPCAGEPPARFEAAGAGNGAPGHGHRSKTARRGNPGKRGCGT